ncbi:MAG: fused response regulator/phosphatase [Spirochaetaceae bacterium]|jgi:sigma-B regulation protein RsbU (phosphoserine phosphatase)|nr:fused response regulator/phosphatase [Spirochaetaceae bacterium]
MNFKQNFKEMVLLVDDEPQVLKALTREIDILSFDKPIKVVTFERTSEALEFLKDNSDQIFLIIADLRMPAPNLSGSDLLLQVHKLYPEIILIMLTAYSDLSEIQKAITADIQSLIFKPWNTNMLFAEIIKARKLYKVHQENRDLQERLKLQLLYAGDFQRKLLSSPKIDSEHILLELKYEPMPDYHCGGDYHDFIRLSPDRYLVLVGDVSGHGIKPAFITAMLKVLVTTVIHENRNISASEFLTVINERLCQTLDYINDIIVTLSAVVIEAEKKMLYLANAGHMPLYLLRNKESLIYKIEGSAMGFMEDIVYEEIGIPIFSGDKFFLYTDGLVETLEKKGILDENEILNVLKQMPSNEPLTQRIYDKSRAFHENGTFDDDVTIAEITIL